MSGGFGRCLPERNTVPQNIPLNPIINSVLRILPMNQPIKY